MKRLAILLLVTASFFTSLSAGTIPSGTYSGALKLGFNKLKLRLNISPDRCTLDSPDQGANGIALDTDYISADSISVSSKTLGASYNATLHGDTLKGVFIQRTFKFKLDMVRQTTPINRPQTPAPPYPYTVIDTVFTNTKAGIRLAGTVVIPNGANRHHPVPAVVFVSGSGAQNRDEELFDHKPFLVIADYLARQGIASLRYDDRGFAASEGNLTTATTADLADDARAAVKFLSTFDAIGKVGIIGHSEGGTIAMIVASSSDLPFFISLAGAVQPCKDIILAQNRRALAKAGLDETQTRHTLQLLDTVFTDMASGRPTDIREVAGKLNINLPEPLIANLAKSASKQSAWFTYFISLDPAQYLSKVKCPILGLGGDKDTQVDAVTNLALLRQICPQADIKIYKDLNHLFQHCRTGEITEYGEIDETISPEVLDDILAFIKRVTGL